METETNGSFGWATTNDRPTASTDVWQTVGNRWARLGQVIKLGYELSL